MTATQLERAWKKSEILKAYLDSMPYRGEIVGIEALAQTLFAEHPSGLDAHEAAIAAALVRSPNAKPADVAERAAACSSCSGSTASASRAWPNGLLARRNAARRAARTAFRGPCDRSRRSLVQASPLDARLQRFAATQLRRQLAELAGRNVEDGAVVVLDNAAAKCWPGSARAEPLGAAEVDAVLARRQPGSTLKPFVYALAFEKRLITPATLLDDSPAQIATGAGLYLPQN